MKSVPSSVSVTVNLIRLYQQNCINHSKSCRCTCVFSLCSLHSDVLKEMYLAFHHNFFCNDALERTLANLCICLRLRTNLCFCRNIICVIVFIVFKFIL